MYIHSLLIKFEKGFGLTILNEWRPNCQVIVQHSASRIDHKQIYYMYHEKLAIDCYSVCSYLVNTVLNLAQFICNVGK